jgi:D-alanine-D-alanine ligase
MEITSILSNGTRAIRSKKIKKCIEIVVSNNPRLNDLPEDARLAVFTTLSKHYAKVAVTVVENLPDLERLVARKPDLVVLGMGLVLLDPQKDYDDSRKVWLASYMKENDINYTGSGIEALILQRNKHEAKQEIIDAGLHTSAYCVVPINQSIPQQNLRFPLFVKPTDRGDGKGIDEKSLVHSEAELRAKISSIHSDCGSDALVEEYLPGREFSVAVIQQPHSKDLLAMPIEITAPVNEKGHTFLSEAVKQADTEKASAVRDDELNNSLKTLAIGAFKALGARDYGRIDMRLDNHGVPHFIEANLMPGLSNHGYLSRCFYLNNHIDYDGMILAIVDLALARTSASPVPSFGQAVLKTSSISATLTPLATNE